MFILKKTGRGGTAKIDLGMVKYWLNILHEYKFNFVMVYDIQIIKINNFRNIFLKFMHHYDFCHRHRKTIKMGLQPYRIGHFINIIPCKL